MSRALSGDPRITSATREKVQRAASEIGYIPRAPGRNLVRRQTMQVAVVVADLTNPYYPSLVNAISRELESRGYRAVLFVEGEDEPEMIQALANGSVDGVVLTSSHLDSVVPDRLLDLGMPIVLVNRYVDGVDADCCVMDNYTGARRIGDFLAGLGHTKFAIVGGPINSSTARDRERGVLDSLRDRGIDAGEVPVLRGTYTYETGRTSMLELLDGGTEFTALICGNDIVAIGALDAAFSRGVRVPTEHTVVGFDDMPMASWSWTNLTTVRQDATALGQHAVRMLLERLADPALPTRRVELGTELVLRGTHSAPLVRAH